MADELSAQLVQPTKAKRRWALPAILLIAVCVVGLALYLHRWSPDRQVQEALSEESDAKLSVHRREWLGGDALVVDLHDVSGSASMASVTRIFLKAAEALKLDNFDKVYLAYGGKEKFYFDGAYFKKLGEERSWQNLVYTIRTLPENARKLDGSPAFETWTGGWLGVLGKQLDDSNEFHRQWWVNDALSSDAAAK